MDLSKITQRDKEEEVMVKTLLEMATKKYNLQKELEGLRKRVTVKQSELSTLRTHVFILKMEIPVLEKQEEMAKGTSQELATRLTEKCEEIGKIQENTWRNINSFVGDANGKLPRSGDRPRGEKNAAWEKRRGKIRQLKVESEIEAMHSYEKYQSRKMEELKLMRDLLEKDSFVI